MSRDHRLSLSQEEEREIAVDANQESISEEFFLETDFGNEMTIEPVEHEIIELPASDRQEITALQSQLRNLHFQEISVVFLRSFQVTIGFLVRIRILDCPQLTERQNVFLKHLRSRK